MHQIYNNLQLSFLVIAGFFIIGSIVFFLSNRNKNALVFLFFGALILGLFMGMLDSYVNYWDEQFHMLVAKNMMDNPFNPMLYKNPVLGCDPGIWISNHIWLHKQPLFLWQMALSMKIFGATPLAGRLPSIIMFAVMVLLVYKIGKNMAKERIGYYAALLFVCCNYVLEMVSGFRSTDHNDVAFMFYTTASIWAWTEYMGHKKLKWVFLIGLFAGAAVLNKWLVGLLVYGGWGISVLLNKEERAKLISYLHLLLAFFVSVVVSLPWQIYTFLRFPVEAKIEYQYNLSHFTHAVENHSGDWTYHFQHIQTLYGEGDLVPWVLLVGFVALLFVMKKSSSRIFTLFAVVAVYGFYSIAATKMISFTVILAPFAFLSFGALLDAIHRKLALRFSKLAPSALIMGPVMLIFCSFSLNFPSISKNHAESQENGYKKVKDHELVVFDYLIRQQPDTSYTFFNVPIYSQVPFMFHKGVHAAYDGCPNEEQFTRLKNQNVKFVVYDNHENIIPSYILEDSTLQIIKHYP